MIERESTTMSVLVMSLRSQLLCLFPEFDLKKDVGDSLHNITLFLGLCGIIAGNFPQNRQTDFNLYCKGKLEKSGCTVA